MQRSMQAPLHQPFTLVFQNCIGRFVSTNLTDTRTSLAVRHNNITLCLGPGTYVLGPLPPPTAERTYIRASQSSTELQCSTTRLHISVVIITTAAITSKFTIIGSPPVHHGDQPPSRSTRARSVSFCTQFGII